MERREFLKATLGGVALLSVLSQIDTVQAKEEKLLRLKNRENPSMLEKKHVPAIVAPKQVKAGKWFEVEVKVGYMVTHPSKPNHWITKICLLCDGKKIAETVYPVGGVASSSAKFVIRLEKSATLEAIENCNLHGTWIGDPVKVEVI
ncbi:desulfoferrodoxin family protein [Thermodesulfatator autotrophicus]|uniref:Desulfoferrodoxin ferrous iron-binding domain-containing protein n=1 Tax=Thermodesulfatator autotrophicus TaxID=1795632 RepID=A0A177E6R1_9BACT|nr:desulfoferrodoxin family protein [Thermodesulfatator autotrophicus]OAG27130.1 hypothetical protein TH606_08450 [Thermodesulfatator autotrophicus]